ncbi:MAG: esterase-like activity of phytase family protein [Hyphomonadaceae bacterium]|nr:esterase-like activity of phytase family protein [Hyphomonadaceae bacterium]
MMRVIAALALTCAVACAPARATDGDGWRALQLSSRAVLFEPDDETITRVGGLAFAGGVELASDDPDFGGLSALEITEDGALYAVTDEGGWFSAQIHLDAEGRLDGVTGPRFGALRDENGALFPTKPERDAEGLALLPDGRFAVSFEHSQSIRLYDLARLGPAGAATAGPRLAGTAALDPNEGPEALAVDADGALIVGAERTGGPATLIWRAPLDAVEPAAADYRMPLDFGYGLVALDRLPNGDFIAVQRFFAPVIGLRIRVLRIEAASLRGPPGQVRAAQLAELRPPFTIDNFEGAAVTTAPDGGVRLYLLSDDNFNPQQRTLLLAFDLIGAR